MTREYGAEPVLEPQRRRRDRIRHGDAGARTQRRDRDPLRRRLRAVDRRARSRSERGGGPYDWFFYVNGVESPVGAADYPLQGGERIWWDYRDWAAAMRVPAVVGSWPQPFAGGYDGERHPVAVECLGGGAACATVRERAGGRRRRRSPPARRDGAIRVLVGPWARLRDDPAAAQIEAGPAGKRRLRRLRRGAAAATELAGPRRRRASRRASFGPGAGLVAATRRYEGPPVWVVTGATPAGGAARPPACSTRPTCATITRWRSKTGRRRRCRWRAR